MKELILERAREKDQNKYRTITIRASKESLEKLDLLVQETNLSRSAIVCKFIEYGLDNYEIR